MDSFIIFVSAGIILLFISAYLTHRWEWKGILAILPVLSVMLIFMGGFESSPAILTPVILGANAGYIFKKKKSLTIYILITSLSLTALYTGDFYLLQHSGKLPRLSNSKIEIIERVKSSKLEEDKKKYIIDNIDLMIGIAEDLAPLSFFINALLLAAIGFIFIKLFFIKITGVQAVKGLEFFRLNDYLIFILISGWLIYILVDSINNNTISIISLNIALMISILYIIQALGVIKYLLLKKNLPALILPLIMLVIFIISIELTAFISILLAGFGALDLWADFRKLDIKPVE